ncbi:MAG: hypothetical protein P8X90_31000, partial [Desulfobacterales bacterium]
SVATASESMGGESGILTGQNGEVLGRLKILASRYLFETENQTEPLSLLVDVEHGQTTRINRRQKLACSMPTFSRQSLDFNPIEVFRFVRGFYTRVPDGRETINSLDCRKTRYLNHGHHLMTAWFFEDMAVPVKVVNHRFPEMNFELQQIRQEKIRPEALTLPEGYQEVSCASFSGLAASEWTIAAGASETVTLETDKAFALTVSDDASDGVPTRGRMIFIRQAPPPVDRVKAPLKLSNGQSAKLAYPASGQIKAIEFHIERGGVRVKRVKPE